MGTATDPRAHRVSAPAAGLGVALALMVLAMLVPALLDWNVRVRTFPPLHADWDPRVGPGTVPALVIGVLGAQRAVDLTERMPWRRLLVWAFVVGLAWMLALAYVDGSRGVGEILGTPYEYLRTARRVTDLHATLQGFVPRITQDRPDYWPTHVAGHPAGALMFFVVLVRLGLGADLAAGLVVTVLAATTAVAVLVTVRALGAERQARRAAPFLVLGPAAIWQCVSADAMFAAVAAWATACLALATLSRPPGRLGWSLAAGVLFGCSVMLSYGLPLLAVLALAVLLVARTWVPLVPVALAALAVVGAFAVLGFSYLDALPAIHDRYWDAIGGRRPWQYWLWGDLAALSFSAGPLAGAGVGLLAGARGAVLDAGSRVVIWLSGAGVAMVLLADLSLMSKAEVERIWLPFVPWVLLACALLPERWRRRGLVLQVGCALLVQHLLDTGW
jgi:methylthioxylose transferase